MVNIYNKLSDNSKRYPTKSLNVKIIEEILTKISDIFRSALSVDTISTCNALFVDTLPTVLEGYLHSSRLEPLFYDY